MLRGEDATREAVLSALNSAGLVHLAGHARARPDLPPLSALPLAKGWLTASDLADVDLEGALVVLSACRTGDSSLRWRNEAWGGFPRALLATGARALIASRWEVRDETAYAWMRTLYPLLCGKMNPEWALTQAARRLRQRKETRHPADWAAFLLIRAGSAEDC
jgi:CHAT domain-containing protein